MSEALEPSDRQAAGATPAGRAGDAEAVALLGPAEVRELAGRLDVTPTKRLGQNFVHDANTVRRIVRVGGVQPGDTVVEVGPGLGSLTLGILEAGASVVAVEIDGRLAAELPRTVAARGGEATAARLTVVHQDALTITELPLAPTRFVANLPYNVSVPIVLQFLERLPSIRSGVVMVQSEVGERLAAEPGSKVYGGPSVKAAWFGRFWTAGQVSRQIFWPVPNVDSILVAFERHAEQPGDEALRRRVFAVVDAAFQQRRKMLRQSLAGLFGSASAASDALVAAGVEPTLRGEQLDVDAFIAIGRRLPVA